MIYCTVCIHAILAIYIYRRCCCVWVVQPFYMFKVISSMTSYSHCYKVILIEVVCQYSVFLLIFVQKLTTALLESVEEEERL